MFLSNFFNVIFPIEGIFAQIYEYQSVKETASKKLRIPT